MSTPDKPDSHAPGSDQPKLPAEEGLEEPDFAGGQWTSTVHLRCPRCQSGRPEFRVRGQFCACGWWRDGGCSGSARPKAGMSAPEWPGATPTADYPPAGWRRIDTARELVQRASAAGYERGVADARRDMLRDLEREMRAMRAEGDLSDLSADEALVRLVGRVR